MGSWSDNCRKSIQQDECHDQIVHEEGVTVEEDEQT
jgi:hypothetical protein